MNKITACMIVKNEDRFVWYAVNSVLPFVSRFLITDTGSTDKTGQIIKSIKSPKITIFTKKNASPGLLTKYRQQQTDMVKSGWMWIVDADEVYPQKTAEKITLTINRQSSLDGIIVRRFDLLGDIYHFQDESIGSYNQFGKIGHFVLRLINKDHFPALQVLGDYPNEYFAQNGISIKARGKNNFAFVEDRIFHAMYLPRSTNGNILSNVINRQKYKIEMGHPIDKKFLPKVFFTPHPDIVPEVLQKRSIFYFIIACLLTPLKTLKRLFFNR